MLGQKLGCDKTLHLSSQTNTFVPLKLDETFVMIYEVWMIEIRHEEESDNLYGNEPWTNKVVFKGPANKNLTQISGRLKVK